MVIYKNIKLKVMANIFNDLNKLVNTVDKAIRITDKLLSEKPKPKSKSKSKSKQ